MTDPLDDLKAFGEKLLPRANSEKEVLDFDALGHAFNEAGEGKEGDALGMLLHFGSSKRKDEMLKGFNDTTFHMKTEDYIARIQEVGFKKVFEIPFHTLHCGQERDDTFYIFWHKDGLVLCMDTYNGDRNSANVYFNYEPNDQRKIWEGLDHVSGGFNGEEGKYFFAGNIDVREGIKHHLETIRAHGKFLNPWKKQDFLWFLHDGDRLGLGLGSD